MTNLSFTKDIDSQNFDVQRFLAESPSLIKIVYGEDPGSYGVSGVNFTNFVYHEAAWQPPSFYVKNLTNSVDPRVYTSFYQRVVGYSADNTPWTVDQSGPLQILWLTSTNNDEPQRAVAKESTDNALLRLQRARGLWMHLLKPGSLRWTDTNNFEAKADIPLGLTAPHDVNCALSGRVTARDEKGRPIKIEYNCTGFPKLGDMLLEFTYQTAVGKTELPNVIVSKIDFFSKFGKHTTIVTNLLIDIEIGIDQNLNSKGYLPILFLSSNQLPEVIIASNGVDYRMSGTIWKPLNSKPPLKPEQFASAPTKVKIVFIAVFITLSISFFTFLIRKGRELK